MLKKCMPLWREAHFEVKTLKTPGVWTTFGRSDVVSRGRHEGLCTLSKVSKTWGFCSISKNDGRRGTFEEDLQRCIFRGAVRETCSSEMLGGPGADFLRGVAFWSIRSSGLLRWFCVTGAALRMTWYHFFVAVRSWRVLYIFTSKCASRHNCVHFFDFEMCFAPQRPAIFHRSCGQLAPHPPL